MIHLIWQAILFGLILAISTGPVFFTIIETSIEKGFPTAAFFALGVIISDAFFILMVNLGISTIHENHPVSLFLGSAGSVLLIIFGSMNLIKKNPPREVKVEISLMEPVKFLTKGFLMNTLNPFVLFIWLTIAGHISLSSSDDRSETYVFFSTVLAVVFSTDLLKAYGAHRIKNYITPPIQLWMRRILGVALIFFGVRMAYISLKTFGL